jgi:hypothetical protein
LWFPRGLGVDLEIDLERLVLAIELLSLTSLANGVTVAAGEWVKALVVGFDGWVVKF